jgi:hypothetical protein
VWTQISRDPNFPGNLRNFGNPLLPGSAADSEARRAEAAAGNLKRLAQRFVWGASSGPCATLSMLTYYRTSRSLHFPFWAVCSLSGAQPEIWSVRWKPPVHRIAFRLFVAFPFNQRPSSSAPPEGEGAPGSSGPVHSGQYGPRWYYCIIRKAPAKLQARRPLQALMNDLLDIGATPIGTFGLLQKPLHNCLKRVIQVRIGPFWQRLHK